MRALRDTLCALQAGIGLTLVAAFSVMSGCASWDTTSTTDEEVMTAPSELRTGLFACTRGGGSEEATLVVREDGSCTRYPTRFPAASRRYCIEGVCPACRALSEEIGCELS